MGDREKKRPWLIRIDHRMRTASFAALFVATGLQIVGKDYSPWVWFLLGLMLLVYPQFQYWRACRAQDPVKTEMRSLLVDALVLGAYAAAIHFVAWLSFTALLGTVINNAFNKGWRASGATVACFLVGATMGTLAFGFDPSPATEWTAAVLCMLGLSCYLVVIGNLAYTRNLQLRSVREELRRHETELMVANDKLRKNIEEIGALQQQLSEQAVRDPLTGLYNRRYLDSTLDREMSRCKREGQPLSAIIIDVDHFKNVNDTYGHQAGDEVLRRLGQMLAGTARSEDIACRYGGEEFLLLMPTMPLAVAMDRADELRTAFGNMVVPFGSFGLQATLSIGVSAYPGHGSSSDELIRSADRALYQAKQDGRNQVRTIAVPPRVPGAGAALASGLVQLVWHEAYESGQAQIDDQHRALFAGGNQLLSALITRRPDEEISVLIDSLVRDLQVHFETEEALIEASGYPGCVEHAAAHAELLERTRALVRRYQSGEADLGEVFQFLAHDVIVRHLLGVDRAYFPCVKRMNSLASEA